MEQEILYNILTGQYGEILETHAMWECISALGIKPFKDGNQWCFLYGSLFQLIENVVFFYVKNEKIIRKKGEIVMKTIEERADRAIYEPTDGHPQEQPEIELDKFANKIDAFTERYKNNPERISIKGAMAFMARMFYQYPSVAREWYENLPKATMD